MLDKLDLILIDMIVKMYHENNFKRLKYDHENSIMLELHPHKIKQ